MRNLHLLNAEYPATMHTVSFKNALYNTHIEEVRIAFDFQKSTERTALFMEEVRRLDLDEEGVRLLIRRIIESSFRLSKEPGREIDATWVPWNLIWRMVREYFPKDDSLYPRVLVAAIESNALTDSFTRPGKPRFHFLHEIKLDEPRTGSPQQVIDYALSIGVTEKDLSDAWLRMLERRSTLMSVCCFECWEDVSIRKTSVRELCRPIAQKLLLRDLKGFLIIMKPVEAFLEDRKYGTLNCLVWCATPDMRPVLEALFAEGYAQGNVGFTDYLLLYYGAILGLWSEVLEKERLRKSLIRQGMSLAASQTPPLCARITNENLPRFAIAAALAELIEEDGSQWATQAKELGQSQTLVPFPILQIAGPYDH
jgi:hypothetical protein